MHQTTGPSAAVEPSENRQEQTAGSKTVLLLFPLIWRPLKPNPMRMLEALTRTLRGYVLTMSGTSYDGIRIGDFEVHTRQHRAGSRWNPFVRLALMVGFPLLKLRRRGRIDAIITYDPYATGLAGLILKTLLRTKLIVQIMGDYHRSDPNDHLIGPYGQLRKRGGILKKAMMRLILRVTINGADAVKVVNRDQERFVRAKWPGKHVFRFSDFAATGYFAGLPTYSGDYLLAVGYPFHLKGIDVVIRAFLRIADRHPSTRLRILGYAAPEELESYRLLAENHDRIEFLKPGWIEDVADQMRGCYAFVHAARFDAMPRVLLEAMACGKPIVSTRTNGGVECVVDGETGLLVDVDDVEGFATAIDVLLSDPARAAALGRAGRERVEQEWSEDRFAERFTAMVLEVTR